MAQPSRLGMTDTQKGELWHRWRKGESITDISRALGKARTLVAAVLRLHGGSTPPLRIGFLLFIGATTSVQARDVTRPVMQYTDLDEKISRACSAHCKGNRRGGYLRSVQVFPSGRGVYQVVVNADLVNKHNSGPILGIGGGAGWSYTVSIRAFGTLLASNCNLRVDRIDVINDRLGIGHFAKGEEGKIYTIANCQRFL